MTILKEVGRVAGGEWLYGSWQEWRGWWLKEGVPREVVRMEVAVAGGWRGVECGWRVMGGGGWREESVVVGGECGWRRMAGAWQEEGSCLEKGVAGGACSSRI